MSASSETAPPAETIGAALPAGAAPSVEGAPPFDTARLEAYLRDRGLVSGPITLRRIGEGHSNLTYLVSDGERRVVVRRPPPPPIPPGGHDVVREARVQRALWDEPVPVPRILAVEESTAVIGAPFYVMAHVAGIVATTRTPPALDTPAGRRAVGEALVDTLAALHRVDHAAAGLGDFGRPSGDVTRHLRRFARIVDPDGHGLPGELGALLDWLVDDPPAPAAPTIVHGDFRLGNVMLAADPPARLVAVLDWELATIGDPLRDVGYLLATYAVPGEPPHALTEMSAATLADGYPSHAELAARYAAATGTEVSNVDWYTAMALWKLAVLFEYQRRRVADGIGDAYYFRPGLVEGFLAAARPLTTGANL
ncbi:phosphotransferase family protein [Protofrankia sp. BMG5.30]|uniref:phosphotransferase family protein n=1 Tax=Protofrankia sp. BMG5.30 TaxID=1834514 RepID=UPI0009F89E55|nr:phosphotransferase family protein [Protofrankia sp. BMG5.30]